MNEDRPVRPIPTDPRLLPYLPLLYVVWADSELEGDEIEGLCARLQGATSDASCRAVFGRWLDPSAPPSPAELASLLAHIRQAAADLPEGDRRGLVEIGLALAREGAHAPGPQELRALRELEEALGMAPLDASARLLTDRRPGPVEDAKQTFDVGELRAHLAEPHSELRAEVLELLTADRFTPPLEASRAAYREHVLERCHELARRGWGGLSFPRAVGGEGDAGRFSAVFETLGHGDLSTLVKFGVQFGLFGGSILHLGTERHHEELLPGVASLEIPGCFAMTETGHGSNVAELQTVATYDAETDEIVVQTPDRSARKDYIGNAACHGRIATVFAQLEVSGLRHGVHAILVPIRDLEGQAAPGVTIEDAGAKMGLGGVDNGRLSFDRVRVPRSALLDRFGSIDDEGCYHSPIPSPSKRFFTMLSTLVGGRVSVGLAALAAAKSGLTIAIRYADRRRQFGPDGAPEHRLLDYLSHQRRLLPDLARTYALHSALRELAADYASPSGLDREIETRAAALKALATRHATVALQRCREACGGQGYLAENRLAALKADTDVFTTFEGDNTVLLQLVAKGRLADFRRRFQDSSPVGMVRWILARAASDFALQHPLSGRQRFLTELQSREVQIDLLRWREERLLYTLARRLRARIETGLGAFSSFVECQDHALEAARAYGERLVLESWKRWESTAPESVAAPLGRVGDLYALSVLEERRAFFLEHGVFDGARSRAVRSEVNRLCRDLRPHARSLVDAFGIPDAVLGAPIAVE